MGHKGPGDHALVRNGGTAIAKEVELKGPEENLGARMLRQAAERTGEVAGDGTSTATVLAQAILAEGIRHLVAGASAVELKRGPDRATRVAVEARRLLSRQLESRREKGQLATISAHNEPEFGKLVADAMEWVGSDGVIGVEESKITETTLEVVEGPQFDRGYPSPCVVRRWAMRSAPPSRDGRGGRAWRWPRPAALCRRGRRRGGEVRARRGDWRADPEARA